MAKEKLTKEEYIQMTIDSEIKPLELRYTAINDCFSKMPVAYKTEPSINSVVMGKITTDMFSSKIKNTSEETELAEWAIAEAMRNYNEFISKGRHPKYISVKVPASLLDKPGLYETMKRLMEENSFTEPEKICLDFSSDLLVKPTEQRRVSILDLKLLKVKTMVDGAGNDDFQISNLLKLPIDMAIVSPKMVSLINNRDNPMVFASFIAYLRSMRVQFIADGIKDDEPLPTLSRSECLGYMAVDSYSGKGVKSRRNMSLGEALEQKEDEG